MSGLGTNESITLLNNGGEALIVMSNGGFTFSSGQASGSTYDVTVGSNTPGITCSVGNASGTLDSSNVTDVAVSCAAGTETVLYSFGGDKTDGMWPLGRLVMDSAGNLYGTTSATTFAGGINNLGTVFEISATGTETILHSFAGGTTDGAQPDAGLIMDSAGNLYGTTADGGTYGAGTVFKISANGTETVLYSFAGGTTDGAQPEAGLIMDSTGNLYGTTRSGGGPSD